MNENLTRDELIRIVVALDNEACRENGETAKALRELKWKVFALAVKAEKEAA